MKKAQHEALFTKGIWIKAQQGRLTMGSLEKKEEAIEVPDSLSARLFDFEKDMIEALYGEKKKPFNPDIMQVSKVLAAIKKRFSGLNLKISFSKDGGDTFKGKYNDIYHLLERFILSSLENEADVSAGPIIYMNISLVEKHLCIIFRDSELRSEPSRLTREIDFIKSKLNGEVSYKAAAGERAYYDIMIPSQS